MRTMVAILLVMTAPIWFPLLLVYWACQDLIEDWPRDRGEGW